MKLYELATDYRKVWDMVADEDADLDLIEDTLQSIEASIEVKAENVAKFIRSMDNDIEIIRAEEKRLADRRRATENRRDRIKEYIQNQLTAMGIDKVKTPTMTVALQNNPPSLDITDEKAIPAKFWTFIPESFVPNKQAIKDAIKAGEEVPGCQIRVGRSLRIR